MQSGNLICFKILKDLLLFNISFLKIKESLRVSKILYELISKLEFVFPLTPNSKYLSELI